MGAGLMLYSILKVPRHRIHSFSFLGHAKESIFTPRNSFGLLGGISNYFEASQSGHALHGRWISRSIPAVVERKASINSNEPRNHRNQFLNGILKKNTRNYKPISNLFTSIHYSDAKPKILERGDSKHQVRVFGMDVETTGLYRERERIIEIAIRDLTGGKNSCFHTLVNPERHVPNSHIHGITTKMVNREYVPRMKDLIPILIDYVNSRLLPGEVALFALHNAWGFDVPFLMKEFSRCSRNIPENWLFLDTLPLARELKKHKGLVSQKISLQKLREYYQIPLVGSAHRAMSDVNVLSSVLERMVSDMNLTVSDLLERSFQICLDNSEKKKI